MYAKTILFTAFNTVNHSALLSQCFSVNVKQWQIYLRRGRGRWGWGLTVSLKSFCSSHFLLLVCKKCPERKRDHEPFPSYFQMKISDKRTIHTVCNSASSCNDSNPQTSPSHETISSYHLWHQNLPWWETKTKIDDTKCSAKDPFFTQVIYETYTRSRCSKVSHPTSPAFISLHAVHMLH